VVRPDESLAKLLPKQLIEEKYMQYNLVKFRDSEESNLTVFHDGEMYVATDTHPNFDRIVAGVIAGDESVIELFDVSATAQRRFDRLSERVTIANGRIFFDGEEVDNALTQQVMRFIDAGVEDFRPLVAFFEKVETNPNAHSREQLFRWIRDRNITITSDGNFIAYKGVRTVDSEDGVSYTSISTGKAVSDGVEYDGAIPNPVGATVEMPRSEVQHDPSVGCHKGLHAGTWNYASGFAQGAVLTVEINPRDVVSVPTDCGDQKLRVCRYIVTGVSVNESSDVVQQGYTEEIEDDSDEDDVVENDYNNNDWYGEPYVGWDSSDPEAPWNR